MSALVERSRPVLANGKSRAPAARVDRGRMWAALNIPIVHIYKLKFQHVIPSPSPSAPLLMATLNARPNTGKKLFATRGLRFPVETLTPEEMSRLIRACSRRSSVGMRNAALLVVLYRGGLRIGEALALHLKDLDLEAGTVRILYGKGNKARTTGLDPGAFSMVERWIARRQAIRINRNAPLFCTLKGGPLYDSYVRHLMKRLARKAGIEKRVHPHGLRHTHAAELIREGIRINVVSKQLGHSSSAVTARYVDHISPAEVIDAMRAREWTP